ncbi:MAG: XrtA system polysaccharide chain length determinant [Gammaproteobacteria bacterium]
MEELVKQIATVARGMWKYRWPSVIVAWVVAAVGVGVVFKIPDQYEATARIHVDTQSILKPLMSGLAVQPNVQQQVAMLSRTLISRPNVEKLVRMADLDLGARTKAQQEQLVTDLMKDLKIATAGRDLGNLYNLSYRHEDREKAQRVIQSLVSIFVESSLGATRRDADSAKAFLDEQIKQYEQRLEEAEMRLKEFRLRNIDRQLTAGGTDSLSRVTDLANQLDQAKLQLREAENARDAAKAQLDAAKTAGTSRPATPADWSSRVSTPEIDSRIDATKRNLDSLLLRFTEAHPDVVAARRLLKDLEAQKDRELASLREAAEAAAASEPAGAGGTSPLYQQLGQMVASTEVQVASLRARVGEIAARHAQAVSQLRTSPALEAELAQLNRDYAIHKRNYDDLVARRESAAMSGELDTAAGIAEFRLIDPPRVSPKPVAPNRLLLLPLALVAGLGAGLFLAFAASQLRPAFHDGNELRLKTQLPLIGVVSAVVSDVNRRRHKAELVKFWSASGSLVLLFMAGMAAMALMAQRIA